MTGAEENEENDPQEVKAVWLSVSDESDEEKKAMVVSNPDGSLIRSYPPGYKPPPDVPRNGLFKQPWMYSEADIREDNIEVEGAEYLVSRHRSIMLAFLAAQIALEILFLTVFFLESDKTIKVVANLYHAQSGFITVLFWLGFGLSVSYFVFYLYAVSPAIFYGRMKDYAALSTIAFAGTMLSVLLVYVNNFNLLIFFFRLTCFSYSRFLYNTHSQIQLLRDRGGDNMYMGL